VTPHGGLADAVERDSPRFCRDVQVTYALIRRGDVRGGADQSGRWTFHIPVADYRALVEAVDGRLARWLGPNHLMHDPATGAQRIVIMADGTSTALERVRDGKVRSVGNNYDDGIAPHNPAAFARAEVQRLLLLFGPAGKVPRRDDWAVSGGRPSHSDDPCLTFDFAQPDPDGWGVGEDDCARVLKAR
jgi:hypothetical protein